MTKTYDKKRDFIKIISSMTNTKYNCIYFVPYMGGTLL